MFSTSFKTLDFFSASVVVLFLPGVQWFANCGSRLHLGCAKTTQLMAEFTSTPTPRNVVSLSSQETCCQTQYLGKFRISEKLHFQSMFSARQSRDKQCIAFPVDFPRNSSRSILLQGQPSVKNILETNRCDTVHVLKTRW